LSNRCHFLDVFKAPFFYNVILVSQRNLNVQSISSALSLSESIRAM
jgi:hypothetical protein